MLTTIIICAVTCALMIAGVLFFPKIKIGRFCIDSYWVITLIGALTLIAFGQTSFSFIASTLTEDTAINPLKILVLFISMTILSVFLDELGFFRYLAGITLKKAKSGQKQLFLYLYLTVSVLTVFTSNDIIILSFTPFICYFAKSAGINPLPYLATEFVAANTWSMALIIGNPTNIYLATAYGIDFANYISVMILPTLLSGITALGALYLLFRRQLNKPMHCVVEEYKIKDKPSLCIGLSHLAVCTALLVVSSYIHIEMWLVALLSAVSLCVFSGTFSIVRGQKPTALLSCFKRAPWQLIPFVISMFTLIATLSSKGVTAYIAQLFSENQTILKYGLTSFFSANLINNIPMSVLFSSIIQSTPTTIASQAVYASIIGSNVGAFLTPIGALAGIMWSDIAGRHGVSLGYKSFLKIGVCVALPTIISALLCLYLII